MLKSSLWQGTNRLNQILKATVGGEIRNNRHAPFRTVPKRVVYPYVLLTRTVTLPVTNPAFEDFSDLTVTYRDLLDAEYFQRWAMQHLLNRPRCRLEH